MILQLGAYLHREYRSQFFILYPESGQIACTVPRMLAKFEVGFRQWLGIMNYNAAIPDMIMEVGVVEGRNDCQDSVELVDSVNSCADKDDEVSSWVKDGSDDEDEDKAEREVAVSIVEGRDVGCVVEG
ncbi:hypothetical protein QAD02_017551 [Eretmocerus hayati]|uniref:Uncharacterized protein n=1 Tax=Eretmocerus hayati TaxID=131215 RepID=A0ACC2PDV5_9HYME|nr:hypothetical protein QAD02_017551 [Eretmocerus hayati]